ncbi:class I SAM-dependent DNA methyltransferase [Micromonospora sp. DT233]|uniref:class I SAM-dependent DNA methyltransferase n=1 Tax=Micromonospora sp. DT233 TaxID=3393432 RepID=UPI003CEFE0B6
MIDHAEGSTAVGPRGTGYDGTAARVYDQVYSGRAQRWAPLIQAFHEADRPARIPSTIVDLCCGNGQLLRHFLGQGYRAYGVDGSPDMLDQARKNLRHVDPDRFDLVEADVSRFRPPPGLSAGLVVSTVDALNHLAGPDALRECIDTVAALLVPGGHFIFDLLTETGLVDANQVGATVMPDSAVISRGLYLPEESRSYTRTTGFLRRKDGLYERFDLNAVRYAFVPEQVEQDLLDAGFRQVHQAHVEDLATPAAGRHTDRVFLVARR